MFGRRILVLVLVLMGLTALAASLSPPPQTLRRTAPSPGAAAAPATPAPAPAASADTVRARLDAEPGHVRRIGARTGDTVLITVAGDVLDTVVNDDLAVSEPIAPGSPALIDLYADTPGRYPIELLDSGRRIGVLRITRSS